METKDDIIVNRVANSGLVSFNLEDYYHNGERVIYDIKQHLFMELILKEKDFREFLKSNDWSVFTDKNVAITCSADAIVPTWAYMLLAVYLEKYANCVVFGTLHDLEKQLYLNALQSIDFEQFRDARVVVKGCSKVEVPTAIYVELTNRLKPIVKNLMFGEPCSTVPLYKQRLQ